MHLVVPFASALSPAAQAALSTLHWPALERLLARLTPAERLTGDEWSLSPPHERVLGRSLGWPDGFDGLLPLAADAARAEGLPVDAEPAAGWAWLTPACWQVGTEQVSLLDPAALALDEPASRAFFDILAPLFDDGRWTLYWRSPTRWYARHAGLATLPTASLDRVIGRNVDLWLGSDPAARAVRRLQAEAQMLLHGHPLNAERERAGLPPVNSFWLSGTGAPAAASPHACRLDDRLRGPALAEDWAAWAEAWAALDAGPITDALARCRAGEPLRLSLCGERHAQTFVTRAAARAWWRRGPLAPRRDDPARWLAAL